MTERGFLAALFHADDPSADSLVLGALVMLAALIGLAGYDVIVNGREFSAFNFGTAGGAVLTALGAGKRWRDGR